MNNRTDDELTIAYLSDPRVENYVALRRAYPDEVIEIELHSGITAIKLIYNEMGKFHLHFDVEAALIDADEAAISEMSLQLMEKLIERRQGERAGRTHQSSRGEAISDWLIDYLIKNAIDALSARGRLVVAGDLIVLIRERLGGSVDPYQRSSDRVTNRFKAFHAAKAIAEAGKIPTYRLIAAKLGVNASSVMRWFSPDERQVLLRLRKPARDCTGQGQTS